MSSQAVSTPNTEAAILARVFELDQSEMGPEVARYLLSMRFPEADRRRVNELSAKARAGSLTENEATELDSYLHIGSLIAVMQSKARNRLRSSGSEAALSDS